MGAVERQRPPFCLGEPRGPPPAPLPLRLWQQGARRGPAGRPGIAGLPPPQRARALPPLQAGPCPLVHTTAPHGTRPRASPLSGRGPRRQRSPPHARTAQSSGGPWAESPASRPRGNVPEAASPSALPSPEGSWSMGHPPQPRPAPMPPPDPGAFHARPAPPANRCASRTPAPPLPRPFRGSFPPEVVPEGRPGKCRSPAPPRNARPLRPGTRNSPASAPRPALRRGARPRPHAGLTAPAAAGPHHALPGPDGPPLSPPGHGATRIRPSLSEPGQR